MIEKCVFPVILKAYGIHSFIHLVHKYLLSVYYVPGDTKVNNEMVTNFN